MRSRWAGIVVAATLALAAWPAAAAASTPEQATLSPNASGGGSLTWTGTATSTPDTANGTTDDCFGSDKKPDPATGCDFFKLDVSVPAGFYNGFIGGVQIDITGFNGDIDLGIYNRNADGTVGDRVGGSGNVPQQPEQATISQASGSYYVVMVPFASPPANPYNGKATFVTTKADPTLDQLNANSSLLGPANFRASHDQYLSHSEPTIVMDPLNHDHLIAGSKMYESLPKYFFKIGTYESFDGGRTWVDDGFLPGYCNKAGQSFPPYCDINATDQYRVTSDVSMVMDDEGNGYANVLDAPGGATSTGWNLNVHIKKPGQPWGPAIVVHDNTGNDLQSNFLDDKNWIAIDNYKTVDGQPNKAHDGKIGTLYVCWSFDGPGVEQSIAVMRSQDGGKTWGGHVPGDNTPTLLSERPVIAGIGCHVAVGPSGEVYATWYDNTADALMQSKSTDRGTTWTPGRPIASITGVNSQFPGQSFRNLSIPTTGVDGKGNVYVVVMSKDAQGSPVGPSGSIEKPHVDEDGGVEGGPVGEEAEGGPPTPVNADIILFKSTDGGNSYTGPVKVNQDKGNHDQFQPWLAITPNGQLDIEYFDRRSDANNYFIQTWLSRSNDGGKTFSDVPVGHLFWDPAVNPPVSPSGQFIGDYQGIAADDNVAIPFWNDTQANSLTGADHSPYQEVWDAPISNIKAEGGPGAQPGNNTNTKACRDKIRPLSTVRRVATLKKRRGLEANGRASDRNLCQKKSKTRRLHQGVVQREFVAVGRHTGKKCRWLLPHGKFSKAGRCSAPVFQRTRLHYVRKRHSYDWTFLERVKGLPKGRYQLIVRAIDRSANLERSGKRAKRSFRVR